MHGEKASEMVATGSKDYLKILQQCGGFYECPKGLRGERLGPLVGYAGKYQAPDGSQKQWVGDIYANFARAEEYPHVLEFFARALQFGTHEVLFYETDIFCGAPLGGYDFAKMLGLVYDRRAIKAEKKVVALATADTREQSTIIFGRHEIKERDNVVIVEDVLNNFSTTDQLIKLIEQKKGCVAAIVCLLNRSLVVDGWYAPGGCCGGSLGMPVISLVRRPINEYKQDDLAVADDIARGNVVWKPKDEWPRLMAAMDKAEK